LITDFLEKSRTFEFVCNTTAPKKVIKKAPEPLTTSSLQQLASNELHLSPKETMKYAQQLYEDGFITYMRTDSKKYSKEFIENVKQYISKTHGDQYISQTIDNLVVSMKEEDNTVLQDKPKKKKKTVAEEKGVPKPQEAHEAIRPVDINVTVISLDIEKDPKSKANKLYDLIRKRTLESCMPSAQ